MTENIHSWYTSGWKEDQLLHLLQTIMAVFWHQVSPARDIIMCILCLLYCVMPITPKYTKYKYFVN